MGFGKRFSFAFGVTIEVPAFAIASDGMLALSSSFETKLVASRLAVLSRDLNGDQGA